MVDSKGIVWKADIKVRKSVKRSQYLMLNFIVALNIIRPTEIDISKYYVKTCSMHH